MESKEEKVNPNVQKILDRLETIEKRMPKEAPKTEVSNAIPSHDEHKGHWQADAILKSDCPECKKQVESIKALGKNEGRAELIGELKKRASLKYECKDCGSGVNETDETCSICGGTHGRKREE